MKTIIAGSRTIRNYRLVEDVILSCPWSISTIISGMARGVDTMAVQFAHEYNYPLLSMPADWSQGRGAGYTRNIRMAEQANGLIAIWDGQSRGTKHMIDIARLSGLRIHIVRA